jgi:toxin ParE1/3/4
MSRFRLADLARADLAEIRHYVARDRPRAAERLIATFHHKFRSLARNPELGERRPELGVDIRIFSAGDYVIVYRTMSGGVEIARVISGYRDLEALF